MSPVLKVFSPSITSPLKEVAKRSNITVAQLAAAVLVNGKISSINCNENRTMLRGITRCSIHAEIGAIMKYYGRTLKHNGQRYCILRQRKKKKEG